MSKNTKQIITMILLGLGLSMFLYGFGLHVLPVYSENNDRVFATAEPALIKEVSIGGLKRDSDGQLHKTYTGAPPNACTT